MTSMRSQIKKYEVRKSIHKLDRKVSNMEEKFSKDIGI
jgi:cell division protein FtsL